MSNGLGLYVSKRIMECLGGSLEVESDPGVKTVFKLSFEALNIRGDPSVSLFCVILCSDLTLIRFDSVIKTVSN